MKKLIPYNIDIQPVPGKLIVAPDFGSRHINKPLNLGAAGIVYTLDSGKLILRNGREILIPPGAHPELVTELHFNFDADENIAISLCGWINVGFWMGIIRKQRKSLFPCYVMHSKHIFHTKVI